jgi:hypothetical protein
VAEQTEHRTGRHREIELAEGPLLVVALAEALRHDGMGSLDF